MKHLFVISYGIFAYAVFYATLLHAVGFFGDLILPKSVESMPQEPVVTVVEEQS